MVRRWRSDNGMIVRRRPAPTTPNLTTLSRRGQHGSPRPRTGWEDLQARITGDPPGLYERIGPAMQALEELAAPADPARPLVEYYRRHDVIELWVPVLTQF